MTPAPGVIAWLLDADPSIRWQVLRDIVHEPDAVVTAERARVAQEGWAPSCSRFRQRRGIGTTIRATAGCRRPMHFTFS